jgi:hypothetical protein
VPNNQQAAIATPLCDDADSTIRFTAFHCHPCLVISQPEAILVCIFALAQSLKWPIRGPFQQGDARCHPPMLIYPCTPGLRTHLNRASLSTFMEKIFSLFHTCHSSLLPCKFSPFKSHYLYYEPHFPSYSTRRKRTRLTSQNNYIPYYLWGETNFSKNDFRPKLSTGAIAMAPSALR